MPKNDFYTYRVQELSEDQLDMTVSIYDQQTNEVVRPIRVLHTMTFVVSNLPVRHQIELDGVVENDQPLLVL